MCHSQCMYVCSRGGCWNSCNAPHVCVCTYVCTDDHQAFTASDLVTHMIAHQASHR